MQLCQMDVKKISVVGRGAVAPLPTPLPLSSGYNFSCCLFPALGGLKPPPQMKIASYVPA